MMDLSGARVRRFCDVVVMCGLLVGCGKGKGEPAPVAGSHASGSSAPVATAPPPAPPSAPAPGDKDRLPPGAIAVIGAARLSSPGFVSDVALSASGQLAMCGDRYARLWEVGSGRLLWSERVAAGGVRCALSSDGARIVLVHKGASGSTEVVVHDWKANTRTGSVSPGTAPWFGSDGAMFVVAKGGVEVRDTASNKAVRKPAAPGIAAGLAGDGALIVVGRNDVVRVKPDGASEPVAKLSVALTSAVVSRDATRVAWTTGAQTGIVDVAAGSVSVLPEPGGKVETLALSPKGDLVAIGIEGGLSVWELAGGKRLWGVEPKRRGLAPALAFSPDGASLVYTDVRSAVIADARTGATPPNQARSFFAGWAPSGAAIVVDDAGKKRALDAATGTYSETIDAAKDPEGRPAWADTVIAGTAAAMAFDDDQLDACAPLKVWIAGHGERTLAKPRACNEDAAGTWQPGPGLVVVNARSPELRDAVANKPLFPLDFGPRPLVAARFSLDGKRLLVVLGPAPAPERDADVYGDKEPRGGTRIEIWSIPDKKLLGAHRMVETGATAAALDATGSAAYLGWDDGTVSRIDTASPGAPRRLGVQPAAITDLALSPDGALVAATDRDRSTTIWKP